MTIENNQETNNNTETIKVDLFGVEVELPASKAKELIDKRDKRVAAFNDLEGKYKNFEKEAAEAKKRAEFAEKAKNGAFEEAAAIARKEVQDKLTKLQDGLIKREIKSTLASLPDFNSEALEDAAKLFSLENPATYGEDDTIKVNDKDLKTVAEEWLKTKKAFQKSKTDKGTGINPVRKPHEPVKERASFTQAVEKFFKDKK